MERGRGRAGGPARARVFGVSGALVLLMGFPGVGKSHCARLLARRLGADVVQSDAVRKSLFLFPSYQKRESARVFREVADVVDRLLAAGRRVVVDATHLRRAYRRTAIDVARRRGAPVAHVLVTAKEPAVLERLAARRAAPAPEDRSDADERVYAVMRARGFEPPKEGYVTLRNDGDLDAEIERVAHDVEAWWAAAS